MTLKELSQLYYIRREIERLKKDLEEIRAELFALNGLNCDGMPRGKKNKRAEHIDMLLDKKQKLESIKVERIIQCEEERDRLENYIANIPDSLTRQIFSLRFVDCLPWRQVAYSIGGNNTEESVRQTAKRYVNMQNECCHKCHK